MVVLPRSASGVKVDTKSMPCEAVENALVKNRKRRKSRAASTPSASRPSISLSVRVKLLVIPDPVEHVDPEVVGGDAERSAVEGHPGGVVERLLRGQRFAAAQRRHRRDGRNGAVVHQVAAGRVEDGRDVEPVLLARCRGAETAAHAGPHEAEAAGELAVHRRPRNRRSARCGRRCRASSRPRRRSARRRRTPRRYRGSRCPRPSARSRRSPGPGRRRLPSTTRGRPPRSGIARSAIRPPRRC